MLDETPPAADTASRPFRARGASLRARSGVLGSGLGAGWLGAVLAVAVIAFLGWGGPLWRAPAGASHLVRILGSYVLVIPLAAGALLVAHRWSVSRLVSSVALVWGAKLVVTATLYLLLAPTAGDDYTPRAAAPTAVVAPAARAYRPAPSSPAASPAASLVGVVLDDGRPVDGAIVMLEEPPPGRALDAPRDVTLVVSAPGAEPMMLVATTRDRLLARSASDELHTLRLAKAEGTAASDRAQTVANIPLPPGAPPAELPAIEPGTYTWFCGVHGDVGGTLVVVDHPYAVKAESGGRFAMTAVPTGALHVAVMRPGRAPLRRWVNVNGDTETTFEMKGSR